MRLEELENLPGRAAPFDGECRWLLSFDFDGTLRSRTGPCISPEFFELMAVWRSSGVRWGINTGRSLPDLLESILPVSPILPDFICSCERYVYIASPKSGKLHPAQEHNTRCARDNEQLHQRFDKHVALGFAAIQASQLELQWSIALDDSFSIEAVNSATMDAISPQIEAMLPHLPGLCMQRAGRYMRLSDTRYNKGSALRHVAKLWHVDEESLFIIGDGHNDLDAFRQLPRAFCSAPAQSHPDVLAYLRANDGHISSGGVIEALHVWNKLHAKAQLSH